MLSFIGTLVLLLLLPLAGCATKRDVRDMQAEIRTMAEQQAEALDRLERLSRAMGDSISVQNEKHFQFRGDLARDIVEIQAQLLNVQELTGLGQRNLADLRDQLAARRSSVMEPEDDDEQGEGIVTVPEAGGQPQQVYNAAVTQKNRGSLGTARRAFEGFLRTYPNHTLAPDARYNLADVLVQEERIDEAIEAFQRIPELHPTSPRVPDALYRIGLLHQEQGNVSEAREFFQRVVNSYPESNSARLARERLNSLP